MAKLKDIPPPDLFYKDPETLTPQDQKEIEARLLEITSRYRALRAKPKKPKEP